MDIKKRISEINRLYDYGEISIDQSLRYLVDLNFLSEVENKYVITMKWILFTEKVSREDFVDSLLCYYPPYLEYLLSKIYKEAYLIGQSGDGDALFEFVNSVPKFADKILHLKEIKSEEDEEIKLFYLSIFKGYPQYRAILTKLKFMQMAENIEDVPNIKMGKTPNEVWVEGRKIASNVELEELDEPNGYSLTPYKYKDFTVPDDIKTILSEPWKVFMIILGMVISEYKAEGFGGISIRPFDIKNPYVEQELNVFIYNLKGKENKIGSLKDFVKEFCMSNKLYLFPNQAPDVNKILFRLMDSKQVVFKDGEYVLSSIFDDRLYSQEGIVIKNRSRKFKGLIKDYIERFRREL